MLWRTESLTLMRQQSKGTWGADESWGTLTDFGDTSTDLRDAEINHAIKVFRRLF